MITHVFLRPVGSPGTPSPIQKRSDVIDLASTPSGDLPHGTPPMLMIGDAETGKGFPFQRHPLF